MEKRSMIKDNSTPNPWQPMSNSLDIKILGKFLEELGECSSAVARCLIQGIDESEPVTGKPNKEWLEDEIADVLANVDIILSKYSLNVNRISDRSKSKNAFLKRWHDM
jgi:NTP pyrophosphatase (non-canonical NTP hydrolase)